MIRPRHVVFIHVPAGVQPQTDHGDICLMERQQQRRAQVHALFERWGRIFPRFVHAGKRGVFQDNGGVNAHRTGAQFDESAGGGFIGFIGGTRQAGHHLQAQ